MSEMLLLLDVGNTNIKCGFANEDGVSSSYVMPTDNSATADSLGLTLCGFARHAGIPPEDVTGVGISSVSPPLNPRIAEACERYFGHPARFVPETIPVPLENRYARPHEVGADRLTAAFAARRLSAAPAVIAVDFGTATTFDCVVGNAFVGGLICPGLMTSLRALSKDTAKLPHIALTPGDGTLNIGVSTAECINQGFLFGFADMVEGVAGRLKKHLGEGTEVIATGGFAHKLAPLCPCFTQVRSDLLLEGLRVMTLAAKAS